MLLCTLDPCFQTFQTIASAGFQLVWFILLVCRESEGADSWLISWLLCVLAAILCCLLLSLTSKHIKDSCRLLTVFVNVLQCAASLQPESISIPFINIYHASSSFCFPLLCISLLIGVTLFLRSRHHEKVKVTLADNMTIWEDVMMTEWKRMFIFSNWWVFLISMSEVYWSFAKHTLLMTPKMLIFQWEINKHRHACAYTYTHTHTVCKNPKRKVWYDMIWYDMIWYDMIWYDMIWYDMIWYDIALYCQTGRKFFLHSSIYVYNNQHPLNNNIHFIHTRTKHIIHCKHYNMPYPFTTLIQLHHVHNTLDFFFVYYSRFKVYYSRLPDAQKSVSA